MTDHSQVNSTTLQQVAKDQYHDKNHMIDDCRIPYDKQTPEAREHCKSQNQINSITQDNQKIMQHTGDDDNVKTQDINNSPRKTISPADNDKLLEGGGTRDQIDGNTRN
ncbi:hypothetical protein F9C28_01835 [Shimwellia pseudoproteus]|nr:hypothetical protein [Shimwellia pseudoproteus]